MAHREGLRRLDGKVALVTGGSRGIGKAVALGLAELGADVAVAARTVDAKGWIPGTLGETVEQIQGLGRRALAVQADLSQRGDVERLIAQVRDTFGGVDILVNNAAYFGKAAYHSIWETTPKAWDLQVAVNLTAPFLLSHAFIPGMRERGGGVVVNVTSGSASMDYQGPGAGYGTTKAALNRLTAAAARDAREVNIAVIALDPGFTRTEIAEIGAAGAGQDIGDAHPVEVPAEAALYVIACRNPLWYSGKVVVAADLAREHGLAAW